MRRGRTSCRRRPVRALRSMSGRTGLPAARPHDRPVSPPGQSAESAPWRIRPPSRGRLPLIWTRATGYRLGADRAALAWTRKNAIPAGSAMERRTSNRCSKPAAVIPAGCPSSRCVDQGVAAPACHPGSAPSYRLSASARMLAADCKTGPVPRQPAGGSSGSVPEIGRLGGAARALPLLVMRTYRVLGPQSGSQRTGERECHPHAYRSAHDHCSSERSCSLCRRSRSHRRPPPPANIPG